MKTQEVLNGWLQIDFRDCLHLNPVKLSYSTNIKSATEIDVILEKYEGKQVRITIEEINDKK